MPALFAHLMLQQRILLMIANRFPFRAFCYVSIPYARFDESAIRFQLFLVVILKFLTKPFMLVGLEVAQFVIRLPYRLCLLIGDCSAKSLYQNIRRNLDIFGVLDEIGEPEVLRCFLLAQKRGVA